MALVGLAGNSPKRDPVLAVEALQGQRAHVRAVHVVIEGDAFQIRAEFRRLQPSGPGRVIARCLEIEVITALVGAGGPRVSGMGAAPPARPVEEGGALRWCSSRRARFRSRACAERRRGRAPRQA